MTRAEKANLDPRYYFSIEELKQMASLGKKNEATSRVPGG